MKSFAQPSPYRYSALSAHDRRTSRRRGMPSGGPGMVIVRGQTSPQQSTIGASRDVLVRSKSELLARKCPLSDAGYATLSEWPDWCVCPSRTVKAFDFSAARVHHLKTSWSADRRWHPLLTCSCACRLVSVPPSLGGGTIRCCFSKPS